MVEGAQTRGARAPRRVTNITLPLLTAASLGVLFAAPLLAGTPLAKSRVEARALQTLTPRPAVAAPQAAAPAAAPSAPAVADPAAPPSFEVLIADIRRGQPRIGAGPRLPIAPPARMRTFTGPESAETSLGGNESPLAPVAQNPLSPVTEANPVTPSSDVQGDAGAAGPEHSALAAEMQPAETPDTTTSAQGATAVTAGSSPSVAVEDNTQGIASPAQLEP